MSRRRDQRTSERRRSPSADQPVATTGVPSQPSRARLLAGAVIGLLCVSLMAIWQPWKAGGPTPPTVGGGPLNVLLITLDTTRADRIHCYGNQGAETPVMDRIAAEGARFDQAVTSVPMTLPSHATIMTGLYPPRHGVRDNGTFKLPPEHATLAEAFQRGGYATAAFVAAFVLDARYGLARGFGHYDDDVSLRYRVATPHAGANPDRPANVVVDAALAWLKTHHSASPEKPFFTWVHLFDPHQPYAPPPPFNERFKGRPYDGEIAFMDNQVGRLVDALSTMNLSSRTLVFIVGDHGEGLGDHDEESHRQLIYESTTRVPMIVRCPGRVPAGMVVGDKLAATIDVAPTILDLVGLPSLPTSDGLALFATNIAADRAVYMETLSTQFNDGWSPLFGLRRLHDKYIEAPTPEYYDLVADPRESTNLLAGRKDDADRLADALAELRDSFPAHSDAAAKAPTQEEISRLAALGYIVGAKSGADGAHLDPKIMIHTTKDRLEAIHLTSTGRAAEAIPIFEKLLSQSPGTAELWSFLADAQMQAGHVHEGVASARRAVELQPGKVEGWCALARYYLSLDDTGEASICLQEAERIDADYGETFMIRAGQALRADRVEEAVAEAESAMRHDPVRYSAEGSAFIGHVRRTKGDVAAAEKSFQAALDHDPRNGTALYGMAQIYADRGEGTKAIPLLQELIEGQVEFLDGGRLLGQLFFETGRPDAALPILQAVLHRRPNDGAAHYQLARVHASKRHVEPALHHLRQAARLNALDRGSLQADPAFAPIMDQAAVQELMNAPQP